LETLERSGDPAYNRRSRRVAADGCGGLSISSKERFMSVLVDLAMFPTDKGESVSPYVSRIIRIIRDSGLPYRFGPMGTSIEGEWEEVMGLLTRCFEELKKDSNRIYMTMKVDYRKGEGGRIESKMRSVQSKL
jgi:uncharacterized protein (TIGR00106 family)